MRTCREPRRAANAAVAQLIAPNPALRFPYRIKTAIDSLTMAAIERVDMGDYKI